MSWSARSRPPTRPWVPVTPAPARAAAPTAHRAPAAAAAGTTTPPQEVRGHRPPRRLTVRRPNRGGRSRQLAATVVDRVVRCRCTSMVLPRGYLCSCVEHDWSAPRSGTSTTDVDMTVELRGGSARVRVTVHSIAVIWWCDRGSPRAECPATTRDARFPRPGLRRQVSGRGPIHRGHGVGADPGGRRGEHAAGDRPQDLRGHHGVGEARPALVPADDQPTRGHRQRLSCPASRSVTYDHTARAQAAAAELAASEHCRPPLRIHGAAGPVNVPRRRRLPPGNVSTEAVAGTVHGASSLNPGVNDRRWAPVRALNGRPLTGAVGIGNCG